MTTGNGKRHRTPTPSRLRKIKRISFKVFLYLKGLFKDFRRKALKPEKGSKFLSRRVPRINNLKTRIHVTSYKKNNNTYCDYQPSRIDNTRNSPFWQWRRVTEWYRYIDDTVENISGHMTT